MKLNWNRVIIAGVIACCAIAGIVGAQLFWQPTRDLTTWSDEVGTMYQIFVYSFADSNGDGVGDIQGIISKLDYLADLGVNGIWLTPVHPSQSYHKYDVEDYYAIDQQFGTLADFEQLITELHERDMKLVMDMVFNHTSNQHPWFIDVQTNPDSPYRAYYALNDNTDPEFSRIGAWHQLNATEHYYGFFSPNMPELNLDNPDVLKEWENVLAFWLEKGVDGFRFDAVKHFYNQGELKTIENPTQQAVEVMQKLQTAAQKINPNVYFVSEVWLGTSSMAPYYAGSDAIFQFDLADAMLKAVNRGEASYIKEYVANLARFREVNPEAISTHFLTNHDQSRLMTKVFQDEQRAKLAASLLLTLPGTSYLYYGEELGMTGAKPDESIREPFPWQADGLGGETTWEPVKFNMNLASAQEQQQDANSIYQHYKTLIELRNTYSQLRNGEVTVITAETKSKLVNYIVQNSEGTLQVIHNLGKDEQKVTSETGNAQALYGTIEADEVILPPFSSAILKLSE
ncbi:MAG: alpha-amylase family glycosyl hydrolase [Culicoidibacterales bacterium]